MNIISTIRNWFRKPAPFPEYPNTVHKTVAEAIAETQSSISQVRSETRDRNKWAYIVSDDPVEMVLETFHRPPGTVTRVGTNFRGQRMVAVWRGLYDNEVPDTEPEF